MGIKLPGFVRGEFFRNVATLVSGTSIAQLIALAIYPLLSRMYTPDDFGVFALYMSILTITNILATAKYELAILMPKEDQDSVNLIGLSSLITLGVSLLLFLLVLILNRSLGNLLGNRDIAFWLYLIPLSTFLNGLYQSLNYWAIRNKRFRNVTVANLSQSLVNSSVKLGGGVLWTGPAGLITGAISGQLAGLLAFLAAFLRRDTQKISWIKRERVIRQARTYHRFPKFNMFLGVSNNLSGNLPVFVLSSAFSSAITGLYSFGITMIFRPMNLLTIALRQVFSQRIILKVNKKEPILNDVRRLFIKMLQVSVLPFTVVAVFAPWIFRVVFGAEWETSGEYVRILIPWLFLVFLSAPFAFLPDLFNLQGRALIIDLVKLVLRAGALLAGVFLDDIFVTLILLSAVSSLVVIYQITWYFSLARQNEFEAESEKAVEATFYKDPLSDEG